MLVKLHTNNGEIYEDNIEDFDLDEFIKLVNDDTHRRPMIRFGGIGIMKNTIVVVDARDEVREVDK